MTKMTKQGVRNLDTLPGKSAGRRLPEPPKVAQVCRHEDRGEIYATGDTYCRDCGMIWEWGTGRQI